MFLIFVFTSRKVSTGSQTDTLNLNWKRAALSSGHVSHTMLRNRRGWRLTLSALLLTSLCLKVKPRMMATFSRFVVILLSSVFSLRWHSLDCLSLNYNYVTCTIQPIIWTFQAIWLYLRVFEVRTCAYHRLQIDGRSDGRKEFLNSERTAGEFLTFHISLILCPNPVALTYLRLTCKETTNLHVWIYAPKSN